MNTFDPNTHIYRIGDKTVPSVTQVLSEIGWVDKTWFTPDGAARGTEVHRVLAAIDRGEECSYDADLDGYVKAWEKFKLAGSLFGPCWPCLETPLYSSTYGLAGTIDRVHGETITEIKTGAPAWWHVYQLGGYALLLNDNGGTFKAGEMVYLDKDGSHAVVRHKACEMLRAKRIFQAALTCVSVARAERK
jgi:hypothetical protein